MNNPYTRATRERVNHFGSHTALYQMRVVGALALLGFISITSLLAGCSQKPAKTEKPDAPANVRSSADVVKVTTAPTGLTAGGTGGTSITLSIARGYHINANPATYDYLIATEITPGSTDGITTGKPVYPAGTKQKFQFADEPLAVYEGETQIRLPLTAAATTAKGSRSLPLNIRVQACDQEKCFPPDTLRNTLSLEIK